MPLVHSFERETPASPRKEATKRQKRQSRSLLPVPLARLFRVLSSNVVRAWPVAAVVQWSVIVAPVPLFRVPHFARGDACPARHEYTLEAHDGKRAKGGFGVRGRRGFHCSKETDGGFKGKKGEVRQGRRSQTRRKTLGIAVSLWRAGGCGDGCGARTAPPLVCPVPTPYLWRFYPCLSRHL
ncbi:hypothetical protein BDY21DRAFT_345583 [Lineolata rhizophorae]|uniref:Uncharacterized protein n=1 Tax=Lineolata rhizophorae TaxID=578093 RepID=A0A6A6P020_9PEZI|nr:hypothetical protein BDY21DRAFT_345583 [Lineolata rhizophorae]